MPLKKKKKIIYIYIYIYMTFYKHLSQEKKKIYKGSFVRLIRNTSNIY